MTVLADPRRLADEAIAAAQPPDPINYLQFAEANIVFPPGEPRPFSAAALSRFAVTTASKTSPSWSTARQR